MSGFKNSDDISIHLIILIIVSVFVLLLLTFLMLKFFQNKIIGPKVTSIEKELSVLESKYVPNLGYLFVIALHGHKFLAVSSKFGIKLQQIPDEENISSKMDRENVDS